MSDDQMLPNLIWSQICYAQINREFIKLTYPAEDEMVNPLDAEKMCPIVGSSLNS